MKLFEVPAEVVTEGVACTWCGAAVGEACTDRRRDPEHPHAQRWRDFWNATHVASERVEVYAAPLTA